MNDYVVNKNIVWRGSSLCSTLCNILTNSTIIFFKMVNILRNSFPKVLKFQNCTKSFENLRFISLGHYMYFILFVDTIIHALFS